MEAKIIQKYSKYSQPQLIKKAQIVFNKFIRERDIDQPCINCGNYRKLQAGHFYAAGFYSSLRFDEDNVHGECLQCNYFNSQSHAQGYAVNIIRRIGEERVNLLHQKAKKTAFKWDRFSLIEIIDRYNSKK